MWRNGFILTLIGGMIAENSLTKVIYIDVGVYLGRCDGLVSQHLLNQSQVGTVLQQVGSKRMTEGMGADILLNTGFSGQALDDGEDHGSSELATVVIDKNDIAEFGFNIYMCPLFKPHLIPFLRFGRDRYQALFTTLTGDNEIALFKEYIADFEIDQFGNAEAAAV